MRNLKQNDRDPQRLIVTILLAALTAVTSAFVLLVVLHSLLPFLQFLDRTVQANVHAWSNPQLTRIMQALTFIGKIEVFVPALIITLTIFVLTRGGQDHRRIMRNGNLAATFAVGTGGAMLLNESFKLYFHRARPHVPWSIGSEPTFSFPSGHALFAIVLYGLIFYEAARSAHPSERSPSAVWLHLPLLALSLFLTVAIGLSRIYLGMHWPTDVLAGYITGACWLAATIYIDRRLHPD